MIRILLLGVSLFLFMGCSKYSIYYPYGKMLRDFNSFYINDSLKVSYTLAGDYVEIKNKSSIKKKLKHLDLYYLQKHLLGYFKTDIEPPLEHFTFFIPTDYTCDLSILGILKDSIYIDTINNTISKSIAVGNIGSLLIVAESKNIFFRNLSNEYFKVFRSIKIGENYRKQVELTAPFSLAIDICLNDDSTVNYILPLIRLINAEPNYKGPPYEYIYIQALATFYSFLRNKDLELQKLKKQWRGINRMNKRDESNLKIYKYDLLALDELVDTCKDKQVVMLNENHFSPNHRMLLHLLINRLYENGFKYLAVEGILEKKEKLNQRKFCITSSGFYTREPSMSNLIYYAIDIGYSVFGYDNFSNQRELNQAKNIYNSTINIDSTAKVIVLAGFGHISERTSGSNKNMMASEFYKNYNIDPLTIDQCEFELDLGNHFIGIVDTLNLNAKKKRLQTDIYISNKLTYNKFASLMGYIKYKINFNYSKVEFPSILSIYNNNQYSHDNKAVPLLNYLLEKPYKQNFDIFLPPGKFIYTVKNKYNKILLRDSFIINK